MGAEGVNLVHQELEVFITISSNTITVSSNFITISSNFYHTFFKSFITISSNFYHENFKWEFWDKKTWGSPGGVPMYRRAFYVGSVGWSHSKATPSNVKQ